MTLVGANLFLDVFRTVTEDATHASGATHVGRAVFDGRFSDLELSNLSIEVQGNQASLYAHAQSAYGPDAQSLVPMTDSVNALSIPAGFLQAGALAFLPGSQTVADRTYRLTALISTPQVPFRLVGLDTQLYLDQEHDPYFFFQDSRRCYWVENQLFYNRAGALQPVTASDPGTPPWTALHVFHVFYHPFTRLF